MTHRRSLAFLVARPTGVRAVALLLLMSAAPWRVRCQALGESGSVPPESLRPCPFDSAEILAALDLAVAERQTSDMTSETGREVGCTYIMQGTSTVLSVQQTYGTVESAASASQRTRERAIPNDPDGAVWDIGRENSGNGNGPKVALKYKHKGVDTSVTVYDGYFSEPEMRGKVLRLKKVP